MILYEVCQVQPVLPELLSSAGVYCKPQHVPESWGLALSGSQEWECLGKGCCACPSEVAWFSYSNGSGKYNSVANPEILTYLSHRITGYPELEGTNKDLIQLLWLCCSASKRGKAFWWHQDDLGDPQWGHSHEGKGQRLYGGSQPIRLGKDIQPRGLHSHTSTQNHTSTPAVGRTNAVVFQNITLWIKLTVHVQNIMRCCQHWHSWTLCIWWPSKAAAGYRPCGFFMGFST